MAALPSNSIPKFRYLSAWFCPFAHRATLALEHHKGRVDYEWVEVSFGLKMVTDVDVSLNTNCTHIAAIASPHRHWVGKEDRMKKM